MFASGLAHETESDFVRPGWLASEDDREHVTYHFTLQGRRGIRRELPVAKGCAVFALAACTTTFCLAAGLHFGRNLGQPTAKPSNVVKLSVRDPVVMSDVPDVEKKSLLKGPGPRETDDDHGDFRSHATSAGHAVDSVDFVATNAAKDADVQTPVASDEANMPTNDGASTRTELRSGDTVYFKASTDRYLDVSNGVLGAHKTAASSNDQVFTLVRRTHGPLISGDAVTLKTQKNELLEASGDTVRTSSDEGKRSGRTNFAIFKSEDGAVYSGDTVYLQIYSGMNLEVVEENVLAIHAQRAGMQAFVIVSSRSAKICPKIGENCAHAGCCADPGMQCYQKDDWWSECMEICHAGPNPSDPNSPVPWTCKAIGGRAQGKPPTCSAAGTNCLSTMCCAGANMQCYEKNATWGTCKASCSIGVDYSDGDWMPWSCELLGPRTRAIASWVNQQCSNDQQDCTQTRCCKTPGAMCYKKDEYWAECKSECEPGMDKLPWSCVPLGGRTPHYEGYVQASGGAIGAGLVAPWVKDYCVGDGAGDSCLESQCCTGVGAQCYAKGKYWARCMAGCSKEVGGVEPNKTWTCEPLGSRGIGLALKGFPSLFCFSVLRVEGYEPDLMREQVKLGAGIFDCDGYKTLADGVLSLGTPPDGKEVWTQEIPKIAVGRSQDGTASNTLLFMKVWDKIIADGDWLNADWTLKVDPDAVVVPTRLRAHLKQHNGKKIYVVNCNKFPGSPNFPMMFGALEVFSLRAMKAYAAGSGDCGQFFWPAWKMWGEDYFMTHCMDKLGVGRIGDFGILGDNMCTGANCYDGWAAAYHPFKSIDSWLGCHGAIVQ